MSERCCFMSCFAGRLYPNGEFGICRLRKSKISFQRRRKLSEEQRWTLCSLRVHGLQQTICAQLKVRGVRDSGVSVPQSTPLDPIGSSMLVNSHRKVRGGNGISRYSARMVRNAAFLLERDYGKSRLSFLTYTLPTLNQEQWEEVCSNWSEIVRVVLQRLRRALVRAGLPDLIVSVTELQEQRMARDRVPGLHLHILFVGRHKCSPWVLRPVQVREFWMSAVGNYLSQQLQDSDWKACERLETVRRSAEGYLGKYMTKGVKSLKLARALCPQLRLPSSWSNLSSSLRSLVRKGVRIIGKDTSNWILDMIEIGEVTWLQYVGKVEKELEGSGKILLGVYGKFSKQAMKNIVATTLRQEKKLVLTLLG